MATSSMPERITYLAAILNRKEEQVLSEWIQEMTAGTRRSDLMNDSELRRQCGEFIPLMREAVEAAGSDFQSSKWNPVREMLGELSRRRAIQGFTPSETATFVLSLKRPLFTQIRQSCANDAEALAEETWAVTALLDAMGLYTTEIYQHSRDDIVKRQQEDLLELSTPVVKLWQGILVLPLIGTLDSARTQVVMESLLQAIVETESLVAIIDITGVPVVDTVVAQHLLKTVTAARLMGAECIISGVRPQIAQTIVHLGINLSDITTKASLAAAFSLALERLGVSFSRKI